MSSVLPTIVACPRCKVERQANLFTSLNGDEIPLQVDLIVAGEFERSRCDACGHEFLPEHRMLFVSYAWRSWIVMHPLAERANYESIERGVRALLQREFERAPPSLASVLAGVRPRLVFGQHMLAEAVRLAREKIDAGLVECLKIVTIREDLQRFLRFGPSELCFQRLTSDNELVFAVHSLATGERREETYTLNAQRLARMASDEARYASRYPLLFRGTYVSASRYLLQGAT